MYKELTVRALFAFVDVVGVLAIIGGIIIAINGASEARYGGSAFPGIAVALTGIGCFIISHIGRSLAVIAQTNAAILERLTPEQDPDEEGGKADDNEPLLPPILYPGQPVGR